MEILLIPLAIITFFLLLPFGLAKLTEAETAEEPGYFAKGFKSLGYSIKGVYAAGLTPCMVFFLGFQFLENRYLATLAFVVAILVCTVLLDKHYENMKAFPRFASVTLFYLLLGVLSGLFLAVGFTFLLLYFYTFIWFYYAVKAHGFTSEHKNI